MLPRTDQGKSKAWDGRPEPLATLLKASRGRLPELLPIKWGRMAASPFGFFRGAVPVMALDLARSPVTRIRVQMCGDAHVRNLGAFAAPDGHLVFDINDFDETMPGPWEWDVKRLAASLVLAGREAGDGDSLCTAAVEEFVFSYRAALKRFAADVGAGSRAVRDSPLSPRSRGAGPRNGRARDAAAFAREAHGRLRAAASAGSRSARRSFSRSNRSGRAASSAR